FGLLTQVKAGLVLMIGGAGCTLATMLARAGCQITILDVNPVSFDVARRHFGLPHSVVCHPSDGEEFLRRDTGLYDAIVLDAFHGDDIPPHLQSREFFALARRHLAPAGVMLANVLVANDSDPSAARIAESMKSVWSEVRLLDAAGIADR